MEDEREQLVAAEAETNSANYGATTTDPEPDEKMGLVNQEGKKLPQFAAALAATLGAMATGTVLGFTSPTEKEYEEEAIIGYNVTGSDFKWVASLSPLGCLIMCLPVGFIMDYIGRKMTMLVMVIFFTVGWALIIWADNVGMLFGGRFLTGMAGGTFCVAAPLYTSEIAQKEIRGSLGSYFQLMVTVGILFVYIVGKYCDPKLTAIFCGVVPFVFGAAFVFMPESPVYALKKGNRSKASSSLQWLRGKGYNIDDELREMQDALDEDNRNPVSLSDSLKKVATRKAFAISFGLMFFQQLSGINAVIFFTSDIFKSAGSDLDPKDASIIVGAMQFAATLVSSLVIDRLGRRILLLISIAVMSLCSLLLAIFFLLQERKLVDEDVIKDIGFLPVLSLSVFVIVFSLGFGPIPWMISAEVFPREVKNMASAAAGTLNWFLAFLVTLFFKEIVIKSGSDVAFFTFMGVCVVGSVFVFFVVPETKGKSLEQIQRELGGGASPKASGIDNAAFAT